MYKFMHCSLTKKGSLLCAQTREWADICNTAAFAALKKCPLPQPSTGYSTPTHPPSSSLIQQCRNLAESCFWKRTESDVWKYIILADHRILLTVMLFAPSTSGGLMLDLHFQSLDTVLVTISHHSLCNYRLTLHLKLPSQDQFVAHYFV